MKILPDWIKNGYLRLVNPVALWMIRHRVNPNTITMLGTLCAATAGAIYGAGYIRTAGWLLGLTAIFDVLDGVVARGTNRTTSFGAFFDSTLDRVADGAVLGGLAIFWASSLAHRSISMVAVTLIALVGAFMVSYTRARAESLGVDAKIGIMQRPERVVLLSAPQAFFGLALDGLVLKTIIVLLAATAWITVVQRIVVVHRATAVPEPGHDRTPEPAREPVPPPRSGRDTAGHSRAAFDGAAQRSILEGE
ncbi:MAG: CDP-alcohol phosphatidyltransferase family protein [Gemmatimonadaceae bacterium]